MKKEINSNHAPKAIGPYSQGILSDGLIFCSGQIALNPGKKELISSDIKEQTRQVLQNIESILQCSQSNLSCVVKSTIFLTDLNDFSFVNDVYQTFFEKPFPARSTVEVSKLPLGAKVEIEVIATIKK